MVNCDSCTDGWQYGEEQYDYPNPHSIEYTNIHFFHLDWFGQTDLNGNICNGTAYSTDFRSIHPNDELVNWGIRGLTGNGLPQNIPVNLSWENDEINNLSNEYEIYSQFYPNIKIARRLSSSEPVAWAFSLYSDSSLSAKLKEFFEQLTVKHPDSIKLSADIIAKKA